MTKGNGVGRDGVMRGGERLRGTARTLPLLALAAWVVMIWVPVLDSANNSLHFGDSVRIVVTSLGRLPDRAIETDFEFVIIWSCLLACAISVWLCNGLKFWSWSASGLGVVVLIFLTSESIDPPTIMWDGQDSGGQWIGGMEVASPAPGAVLWTVGGIALIAAGICGLIGERRRSGKNDGPRITRWFSTKPGRDGQIRARRHRLAAEHIARLLPLVSVSAWVVMIWVPIFSNRASAEHSVTMTSLGRPPFRFSDIGLDVILPWAAVLLCAAIAWLVDPPLWWSMIVIVIGLALFIMLEVSMIDPPTARLLITDSSGERRGATLIGYPDAGVSYWVLGSGALVLAGTAGIAGFIGDRQGRSFDFPQTR
ncbi:MULTISPECIES: hypothetical protein [Brevibacterium]|uniref:Uncharacterized protein n=1 Tax=Brevibacterium antiquum CNRZ 918 TaxID=1255637 RepID=A0A2H1IV43_9MICO|nr:MULTISPECIES: hypothetical protein [Brevibacterium]SMX79097.1 hypothetical protein BANT918_01107 [Brevibacterium antiquum CNRZ 918]HCG56156.1 hypothetical protein [Brevibacterium sp.]